MTKFKLKVSVWILILAAYYSWVGTKTKTVKILQQKVGLAIFKSYSRATAILERVSRATGWLGFWRVSLGAEVGEVLSVFGGGGGAAAASAARPARVAFYKVRLLFT